MIQPIEKLCNFQYFLHFLDSKWPTVSISKSLVLDFVGTTYDLLCFFRREIPRPNHRQPLPMVNWIRDRSKMDTYQAQQKENWMESKIFNVVKHFWRPVQPFKNTSKTCYTITINRPHRRRPRPIGCPVQVQPIKMRNHILHSKSKSSKKLIEKSYFFLQRLKLRFLKKKNFE